MLQMMTRMDLIEELRKRGYEVMPWEKMKNGVAISGMLVIGGNHMSSFFKVSDFLDEGNRNGKTISAVAADFISFYEKNRPREDFDMNNMFDKEYVLSHINIALQKPTNQLLIKRPCTYFGGTEQYLYFSVNQGKGNQLYTEVTREMLENVGISEEEAWERAKKNLHDDIQIKGMAEIAMEMMKEEKEKGKFTVETDAEFWSEVNNIPMYFMSNKKVLHGASSVLDTEVLTDFAKKHDAERLLMIPSSVHEVIIILNGAEEDLEFLKAAVKDVNKKEVSPEEQLSDVPFIWYL